MEDFKRQAFLDIAEEFFDPDIFGEMHNINGRDMLVIIDSNEAEARSKNTFEHARIDGIFVDDLILYVPRKVFGEQPAKGRQLSIDGNGYRVTDSRDEGGVYSISLRAIQS